MAMLTCVLAIAGCTRGGDSEDSGGAGGEEETTSTGDSWEDADACESLTEDEVTQLLGEDHPEPEASDEHGRPTCEWQDPTSLTSLRILLWDPPIDGVTDDPAKETIDVGEHTGYISTQSDMSCDLNVETPTATVGVDLSLESEQRGDDDVCEVAAATAGSVIDELGW